MTVQAPSGRSLGGGKQLSAQSHNSIKFKFVLDERLLNCGCCNNSVSTIIWRARGFVTRLKKSGNRKPTITISGIDRELCTNRGIGSFKHHAAGPDIYSDASAHFDTRSIAIIAGMEVKQRVNHSRKATLW